MQTKAQHYERVKLLSEVVRYDQKIKDKMPAYVIGFNDDNPLINKRFDSTSLAAQQKQRAIADNYEQENQPITWKIKQLPEGRKSMILVEQRLNS